MPPARLSSLLAALCLFAAPFAAQAARQVTITWDKNAEPDVAGYHLLYGTASGSFTQLLDVSSGTSAVVSNLIEGGIYYFAVTAYNTGGMESLPSDELIFVVPGVPNPTPTPSPTPSTTPTPTPSATPTPTPTPNATPTPTVTPSATPTPSPGAPTVSLNASQIEQGGGVLVMLNNGRAQADDVIAMFSATGGMMLDWFFLNGQKTQPAAGTSFAMLSFSGLPAGRFEFRYISGQQLLATSAPLLVGSATPTPTPSATPQPSPSATPATEPHRALMNVSTRLNVRSGENVLIGGLIVSGTAPKKVLLRATGPSLASAGLKNYLVNPTITLYDSSGAVVAFNDNWRTNAAVIQPTGLAPKHDYEAAVVATLAPGAYTAALAGASDTEGVALMEIYDLDSNGAEIRNMSTRGLVATGENVMIGGLIVGGTQPAKVVVRAVGPSLAKAGVTGALADPVLELYNSSGTLIFQNDNWRAEQAQQLAATGLAPTDDREAAILGTLPPGSYTAVVHGAGQSSGVALVEVYDISK